MKPVTNSVVKPRISSVDALRGFAVIAIMLLHFVEHFIYNVYPATTDSIIDGINDNVKDAIFFVFAGKSYAIFALLFGFTFAVQYRNQVEKGKDFAGRFAWRLALLFLFGCVNAAFFPGGDVLVLFAVMGFILIPVRKLSISWLVCIATLFLIQPIEIYQSFRTLFDPGWQAPTLLNESYYPALKTVVDTGNFWEMVWANLTTGQLASFFWAVDAGRVMQTAGLFILGYILGKGNYYDVSEKNYNFWSKILVSGAIASFILFVAKQATPPTIPLAIIFTMWYNVAFTAVLVSAFLLLYRSEWFQQHTSGLQAYGRMSLSNYISQSIIGSLLFFPYALNLAPHMGFATSFVLGLVVMALQIGFCRWWLSRHPQGPLEGIWHKLTWINK